MDDILPKEYPFFHVYAQQKAHQPVIIKANTEGLCVLLNLIATAISEAGRNAIAHQDSNGVAEVFCGDAEVYEVRVQMVNTHSELAPVPYEDLKDEPK